MDEASFPDDETLAEGPPPPGGEATMEATIAAGSPGPDAGDETIGAGPSPIAPGRAFPEIPGYAVLGELGRGGMGVVYRARATRLGRVVALKMILAGDHAGPEAAARFLAEAGAIAKLQHPNVVQIFQIGEHRGYPYFEMEYVEGGSLADRLDGAPRPPRRAAELVEALARAMAEAHRLGIVHRDLKPANILLAPDGTPKVADFGLAKLLGADSGLTRTDSILGSPSYMAPEQAEGKAHQAGLGADVYALGAILYEQLTGRPPFRGATVLETLQQVKQAEPVPPARLVPGLPRDVDTICRKCLEKAPGRRYASAEALAEDLRRFLAREPIAARPVPFWERGWKWAQRRPAVAGLAAALALAFAALLALGAYSYDRNRKALETASKQKVLAEDARALEAAARRTADADRHAAEVARNAALAETYRAGLSEARALRAGHAPGWRGAALGDLANLATLATPRRDPVELRTEAVACLGDFDVVEAARLEGFGGVAFGMAFSPDGRTLATAHRNGEFHLWDVARGEHAAAIPDPLARALPGFWPAADAPWPAVRFRPDGVLARSAWGHRLEFLDAAGLRAPGPDIKGGSSQVRGVAFDAAGRRLAVGWSDSRIDLLDAATGAVLRTAAAAPHPFALSPDGRWLATAGPDNSVQLRPTDGEAPTVDLGRHRAALMALAFSPDGSTLASTSWEETVMLWDVAARAERLSLRGHTSAVTGVAFSPDGAWVATASGDHTARIWEAQTGRTLAVLPCPWSMMGIAFSPAGDWLAVASGVTTVDLYRITGRGEPRPLPRRGGDVNAVRVVVAAHPRLARLAFGAGDRDVVTWDARADRPIRRWAAFPGGSIQGLAYSPDGVLLAVGGSADAGAERARLWDAEAGSLLQDLGGHAAGVRALAFDPPGRRLATGDGAGLIIIREPATGRVLRRESPGGGEVDALAFLDGGRRLAALVGPGPILLYDLEGSGPPRRAEAPGVFLTLVADPGRRRLIAGRADGGLMAFASPDLAPVGSLPKAHDDAIEALALGADGRLLATGGKDRRIVLRDAVTFEPLLTFPPRTSKVEALALDARAAHLFTADAATAPMLWDLDRLRAGLAAAGLAWDRPPHPGAPAEGHAAGATPRIIRPGTTDPAVVVRARALLDSGSLAAGEGRPAAAGRDLRAAGDLLRGLRRANPGDRQLASLLAASLTARGAAARAAGAPAEALAAYTEARAILEAMDAPQPDDLGNLARACAQLAAGSPPAAREPLAALAVATLARRLAAGVPAPAILDRDRDLDPLRDRADFRALMLDRGFPADPFAPEDPGLAAADPPPPAASRGPALSSGLGVTTIPDPDGVLLVTLAAEGPAAKDGRLRPGDLILGVEQEIPFAGKAMDQLQPYLRGEPGTRTRLVVRPAGTTRREFVDLTSALYPTPDQVDEDVAALDVAIARQPHVGSLRSRRGDLNATRGHWAVALADFCRAIELGSVEANQYSKAAALALRVGDVEGYRRLVRAMLDRYATTEDLYNADRTAKGGSLRELPAADRSRLSALAELAVTRGAGSSTLPWFRLARGMTAYRDGQFDLAVESLANAATGNTDMGTRASIASFAAMAKFRLGRIAEARDDLDRARKFLGPEADDPAAASWHDHLIGRLALREAEALIRPAAAGR